MQRIAPRLALVLSMTLAASSGTLAGQTGAWEGPSTGCESPR
jgi:hypothetical protein